MRKSKDAVLGPPSVRKATPIAFVLSALSRNPVSFVQPQPEQDRISGGHVWSTKLVAVWKARLPRALLSQWRRSLAVAASDPRANLKPFDNAVPGPFRAL